MAEDELSAGGEPDLIDQLGRQEIVENGIIAQQRRAAQV